MIGGYISIVWMILGLLTCHYQNFNLKNSFVREFYRQNKDGRRSSADSRNDKEDGKKVETFIKESAPANFNYGTYVLVNLGYNCLTKKCCCCCLGLLCCKKCRKVKRTFKKAVKKYEDETDLRNFVIASRSTRIMRKIILKPHQAKLVKYFKRYKLDVDTDAPSSESEGYISTISKNTVEALNMKEHVDGLLRNFQPDKDKVDEIMEKEITKDINDDADDESGKNVVLRL